MISKERWAQLIRDFHDKKLPPLIAREQTIDFESTMQRAISLIGPRRAGKTYQMFSIIQSLWQKHEPNRTLYINFEKPEFISLQSQDLVLMLDAYYELYPHTRGSRIWLFLDEIQNVTGWEIFVRSCLDEGNSVFLSGSSAKLLSKEIATSMRGRNISYTIYPFSFREFLSAKTFEVKTYFSSAEKALLGNYLQEYIVHGGYPEAILYKDKREKILQDIFNTAIYKDVIERGKIRNVALMQELIQSLLHSTEFSIHKFHNYCKSRGMKTSKNSLYTYAHYLSDAFFAFFLRKHSISYKKSGQSLPKAYFADNGLLTLHDIDDKGRLLENMVFLELMRRGKELAYYQNQQKEEVDFVLQQGTCIKELIQVCYNINNPKTKEREIRALLKASKDLKCNNLILITNEYEKEETTTWFGIKRKIKYIPLWKWLLERK